MDMMKSKRTACLHAKLDNADDPSSRKKQMGDLGENWGWTNN